MEITIPDEYFSDEELKNTPIRYQRFLDEWLRESNNFKFTVFPKPEGLDQMVTVKNIDFYSLCSHHLAPFIGKASIAYIPNEKICGLSKLARVVDKFAHKPQVQERLTQEIADYLIEQLSPLGLMVVLEAEHLCMSMRGIRRPGHKTITSAVKGLFTQAQVKSEFLSFMNGGK